MPFVRRVLMTLVVLLQITAPVWARDVVRVDGEPISEVELRYVAQLPADKKLADIPRRDVEEALRLVATNRKAFLAAKAEYPAMVEDVTRSAELAVARDYYGPFLARIAKPVAEKRVTLDSVREKIPPQEELVFLYQISMHDRAALEALRKRIASGEIGFEEAAKKYSVGVTAKKGGMVGGIKREDSRYLEPTLKTIFATPKGEMTQIIDERLSLALFWVKDRMTGEERKVALAKELLPDKILASAEEYAFETMREYDKAADTELYVKESNAQEFLSDPERVAMKVDGVEYRTKHVMSRAGGKSHGVKDFTTIAENCFRDLIVERVFVDKMGSREELVLRRKGMTEQYVARQYMAFKTQGLAVTEAEVDEYIARNQQKYGLPDRLDLGVIFVKSKQRLDQVQERLKTEDFETVAKGWSQDPKYASLGGRVGLVPMTSVKGDPSKLVPGTVLPPMEMGEKENKGWYILKVFGRIPPQAGTRQNLGDQVVGGVRAIIMAKKKEQVLTGIAVDLMKGVKVEVLI